MKKLSLISILIIALAAGFAQTAIPFEASYSFTGSSTSLAYNGTQPAFDVSVNQLTGFTYLHGFGPSTAQRFSVSGINLTPGSSITVTAPSSYRVCRTENGNYVNSVSIYVNSEGVVALTYIYVYLRANLFAGTYDNEEVVLEYQGLGPKSVTCFGKVTLPPEYYVNFERENETKTNYDSGTVNLGLCELSNGPGGLDWDMTGAMIGTSDVDYKIGRRSARLAGYGSSSMTMLENKPNGAGLVTFKYRRFGTEAQTDWKVEYITDQGGSWTQVGSAFTAPSTNEVQTFSGEINTSRPVRIRIVRATADGNTVYKRLNIDNIKVMDYYDFYHSEPKNVNGNQITITGGNANYSLTGENSTIPNTGFTPSFHRRLTLLGEGPWTFQITNANAGWAAYKQGNTWYAYEMLNGTASFTVYAAKNAEIELLTGSGGDPGTVPVTLSHFSATLTAQNYVQLTWISQSESNLMGYNVYRSTNEELSSAIQICPMIAGTNTSMAQTYTYNDKELVEDGTYYYWLQSVDLDGTTGFHGPVSVVFSINGDEGAPSIPTATKLDNAYPNPFNPNTTIRYQLKDPGKVKIDIYNLKGHPVRSFSRCHDAAGRYSIVWDGSDSSGNALPSGVYLYKMSSGGYNAIKKLVLQK